MNGVDLPGHPAFVFRSPFLGGVRFEGRPVEQAPPDGTMALMYRRNDAGYGQCGVGEYQGGAWTDGRGRDLDPIGLYWMAMVNEPD
jgi:hypothetical protein